MKQIFKMLRLYKTDIQKLEVNVLINILRTICASVLNRIKYTLEYNIIADTWTDLNVFCFL